MCVLTTIQRLYEGGSDRESGHRKKKKQGKEAPEIASMPEAAPAEAPPQPRGGAATDEATSSAALQKSVLQGDEAGAQVEEVEPRGALTAEAGSLELQGAPLEAAEATPGSLGQACGGQAVGDERVKMRRQLPQTPPEPSRTSAPPPARCRINSHEAAPLIGLWSILLTCATVRKYAH